MAGAFSGRLVNSYQPNSPLNSSIVTHESIPASTSFSLFGSQSSFANDSISEETAKKIASLQVKLNQKLGPEFISQRPGPGGGPKLTYAEGWKVINLANEVFGFNGWSSSIVSLHTDFIDFSEASGKYNVGVTAIVRVTLRDGTFHEDIGYGLLDNGRQKGAALDKSKKEAVTDAIKRALRNFGNVLGNCLYDKSYTSEVVKMKVPPVKFKKDELHRLPEFDGVKPDLASTSGSTLASTSAKPPYPNQANVDVVTPTRQPIQQDQTKPLSSIPAHVRSEIPSLGISSTGNVIQTDVKGKGPVHPTGLNTPITPLHPPPQRLHLNPPQYHHQPDRKVSFADHQHAPQALTSKPPSAAAVSMKPERKHSIMDSEVDESFGFNSDDDAFFALADLGPPIDADGTDAGRPIDSDEGRPIYLDEGLLGDPVTVIEEDVFNQHQHQQKAESSAVAKLSRRETIAAALLSAESKANNAETGDEKQVSGSGSGFGNPSGSNLTSSATDHEATLAPEMPNKMLLQANADTNAISGLGVRSSILPPPHQQQQNQNQNQNSGLSLASLVQQRHRRHMAQRNQNQNQMGSSSSSNVDEVKRFPTSIGGFHFPPGVNPLQQGTSASSSSSSSPSCIGLKRPAEAMVSDTTRAYRTSGSRPGIGMGLQQSISGPGVSTGTREILGGLEVGDTGDVKRVKR